MICVLAKGVDPYEKANYLRNRCYRLCRTVCRHVATERRGGDLPAVPVKAAVSAKIEAQSEETPHIFISADIPAPKTEPVAISEPEVKVMMAEKETEKPAPMPAATKPQAASKSAPASAEPKSGDRRCSASALL